MDSIGFYIHFPFCLKKCYYCDFNSYSEKESLIDRYIEALKREILLYKEEVKKFRISTIYFGGGTPSVLPQGKISEMMEFLYDHFEINDFAEISIEVNPGTLTINKLKEYYGNGINRLSIGLQACQERLLHKLGRIHSYQDFLTNLEEARKVGFSNINVDLMFALPGQKIEEWIDTLRAITELEIPHISAYSLIIEEGTPFAQWAEERKLPLVEEEEELKMFHLVIEYLKDRGYLHYEISNFAKPFYPCQHNIQYWRNKPYLGFGAGAHSYLNSYRWSNVEGIETYIGNLEVNKKPTASMFKVSWKDEVSETMFLGLRLTEGISVADFEKRFKVSPFEIYGDTLGKLRKQRLLDYNEFKIYLTNKGIDLSNQVFQQLLLD